MEVGNCLEQNNNILSITSKLGISLLRNFSHCWLLDISNLNSAIQSHATFHQERSKNEYLFVIS